MMWGGEIIEWAESSRHRGVQLTERLACEKPCLECVVLVLRGRCRTGWITRRVYWLAPENRRYIRKRRVIEHARYQLPGREIGEKPDSATNHSTVGRSRGLQTTPNRGSATTESVL